MGGKPAYVQYVSACQVNLQAPDITAGTVSVTVANSLGTSDPVTVTFQEFAPALFTWSGGNVVASRVRGYQKT